MTLTYAQAKSIDHYAYSHLGFNPYELVAIAGYKLACFIKDLYVKNVKANIICVYGKGFNGSDALVASRWLNYWGYNVELWSPYHLEDLSTYNQHYLNQLKRYHLTTIACSSIPETLIANCDCLIDGLLGVGVKASYHDLIHPVIKHINALTKNIVSVDVPSGLLEEKSQLFPVIQARYTYSFVNIKQACLDFPQYCGTVSIGDIGIKEIEI